MVYIDSPSTDPRFNLALEQFVFENMDRSRDYFMLWQNHNTIVVGKHQNTAAEINQQFVDQNGIQVVRRLSGGGAVYHDMGNLNFTFVMDSEDTDKLDFALFCQPVVQALARIGVHAEINGRNDIEIDGRKFSGNSQYIRSNRVMHHGTILFNSDLSVIGKALQASKDKFETKGKRSVRSRVANVAEFLDAEVTLGEFKQVLLRQIMQGQDMQQYTLTQKDMQQVSSIQEGRYNLWEWNYGKSPACSIQKKRRIEGCGEVLLYLDVADGIIKEFHIRGDYFGSGDMQDIACRVTGCRLDRAYLLAALGGVNIDYYINNITIEQFVDIIVH